MKLGFKQLLPLLLLTACHPYQTYQESLRKPEDIKTLRLSNGEFLSTPDRIEEFENLEKLYLFSNKRSSSRNWGA